ncbi:class A beta-lactamase [Mycolicibacterium sp. CBMA 226]|uniref:class A beta-lactamase n=1 Tax=Mycolicibacterium sp. CBMA 226 TaxID=2606611 RepID=UPI00130CC581|nr:class A beta-lactamase [Mycolicibacterium sp. CBMA 226]MUL75385.1 class A beta-lactamase [Mycolicibacterium sp. CBMA 226]
MGVSLNRRDFIVGLAATGVLAGCRPTKADEPTGFEELEDRYQATIGVYAVDLESSATVEHRTDERFSICSTFKAYAAARILQMAQAGHANLEAMVPITAADIVVNSPVLSQAVGSQMALREICAAALTQSDNAAGNIMLRTIGGPSAITDFARSIGDSQTRLDRREPDLNDAAPGDLRDTTTPRALCGGYRAILVGDALSGPGQFQLQRWMSETATSTKRFRAGLPAGWTSADKTGSGDYGSTNDAGILIGPKRERVMLTVLIRTRTLRRDAGPFNEAVAESVRSVLARLGHS